MEILWGKYYDTESSNIYLRNRYYNPDTGRFITQDPIRSGLNWYTYCSNNPISFIDPSGLCYYNKTGNWSHDNWEYSDGYEMRKDPMIRYMDGEIRENDKDFEYALTWWSTNGKYKHVDSYESTYSQDYNRFDKQILAFSNYWNKTLNLSGNQEILPNLVKAMIMQETLMGYIENGECNGLRDVMQCLDDRNPAITLFSRIGGDPNEGLTYGIPKNGYEIVRNLYPNKSQAKIDKLKVTPSMSILFGTRLLGYQLQRYENRETAVIRYNGGGDKEYLNKVQYIMKNKKHSSN